MIRYIFGYIKQGPFQYCNMIKLNWHSDEFALIWYKWPKIERIKSQEIINVYIVISTARKYMRKKEILRENRSLVFFSFNSRKLLLIVKMLSFFHIRSSHLASQYANDDKIILKTCTALVVNFWKFKTW